MALHVIPMGGERAAGAGAPAQNRAAPNAVLDLDTPAYWDWSLVASHEDPAPNGDPSALILWGAEDTGTFQVALAT